MHIERRRVVRRAVSGGVLLAALSALPLGALELAYVFAARHPSFGSGGEAVRFSLLLVLLLVSAGAVIGALEGLVLLGVSQLTALVARRRVTEARWMAWFYSLLVLPGIAVVAAKAFAGRRAQLIPAHDLIAVGVGLVGLVGAYLTFRLVIAARDRFRVRRWGPRQAALIVPVLLLAVAGLYVVDQRVLARLYGFFHVGVALLAIGVCQLSLGTIYAAYRPSVRWIGRLAEPYAALMIVLTAVAGAAFALSAIGRSESLRFLYFEHTAVQAKVLAAAGGLGLMHGGGPPPPATVPAPVEGPASTLMVGPRKPDANVLLISVDALRADHMGAYGYKRRTTPQLDAWASSAARFERAYCQVPHTSFSVTSLMTGTYIYSLSTVDPGRRYVTLPEVLRRYGYKTAGFFPPAVFYIDRNNFTAFEKSKFGFEYVKYEYLDADKRIDQVLTFLRGEKQRRVFVWIHFFEPHEPYDPRPGFDFGPRAVDRYDSEVAYVDHHIGRLLDFVRRELPNTFVALTADHGEEFGEHGGHYHGNALYDQQVGVPLIVGGPGIKAGRIAGAAQVIDLPVTLLSLVDVPAVAGMRGTDLGPWLAGEDPQRLPPAFSEMERKKLVVHGGHKLLCDTARDFCELYDLQRDPGETQNLIGRRGELAAELRRQLQRWMASHAPRRNEDDGAEVATLLDRGRQKDPGAIPGLIKLADGQVETRREAVRLLTLMRAAPAQRSLVRAMHDADPGVRLQAIVGAALLGDGSALAQTAAVLQRVDLPPALRRDALLAQARAGQRHAALPLAAVLDGSRDIYERVEIIEALGRLGDEGAAPALLRQLTTLRTRLYAIEALGQVRARAAVLELSKVLAQDRFISWRKAAARALGQIGDPRGARPLQQAAAREMETDVAVEALGALARLGGRELSLPGLTPLPGRAWACANSACVLELGVDCASAEPRELVIAARVPAKHAAPVVLCGEREVATVLGVEPAAVVGLPRGQGGRLRLRSKAPVELRYIGLRPVPRKAEPPPEEQPEKKEADKNDRSEEDEEV
jgi:arylsulfatase A-like enzyme